MYFLTKQYRFYIEFRFLFSAHRLVAQEHSDFDVTPRHVDCPVAGCKHRLIHLEDTAPLPQALRRRSRSSSATHHGIPRVCGLSAALRRRARGPPLKPTLGFNQTLAIQHARVQIRIFLIHNPQNPRECCETAWKLPPKRFQVGLLKNLLCYGQDFVYLDDMIVVSVILERQIQNCEFTFDIKYA